MIIRKLDYLEFTKDLKKVELDIYEGKKIGFAFAENTGFVIFESLNDEWSNVFFVKTNTLPENYVGDLTPELERNKEEFVGVVNILSDSIYPNDIKEYEKKHPEFIFLKAMDMFTEGNGELIEKDSPFYKLVEDGFFKLDVDLLNNLS